MLYLISFGLVYLAQCVCACVNIMKIVSLQIKHEVLGLHLSREHGVT